MSIIETGEAKRWNVYIRTSVNVNLLFENSGRFLSPHSNIEAVSSEEACQIACKALLQNESTLNCATALFRGASSLSPRSKIVFTDAWWKWIYFHLPAFYIILMRRLILSPATLAIPSLRCQGITSLSIYLSFSFSSRQPTTSCCTFLSLVALCCSAPRHDNLLENAPRSQ